MSNTCGCTHDPPVKGIAQMSTAIPPVAASLRLTWSWYCHRFSRAGFQIRACGVAVEVGVCVEGLDRGELDAEGDPVGGDEDAEQAVAAISIAVPSANRPSRSM